MLPVFVVDDEVVGILAYAHELCTSDRWGCPGDGFGVVRSPDDAEAGIGLECQGILTILRSQGSIDCEPFAVSESVDTLD